MSHGAMNCPFLTLTARPEGPGRTAGHAVGEAAAGRCRCHGVYLPCSVRRVGRVFETHKKRHTSRWVSLTRPTLRTHHSATRPGGSRRLDPPYKVLRGAGR